MTSVIPKKNNGEGSALNIQKLYDNASQALRGQDEDSGIRGSMLFRIFQYPSLGSWKSWILYTKDRTLKGSGFIREMKWEGESTIASSTSPKIYHRAHNLSQDNVSAVLAAIPKSRIVLMPNLPQPQYLDGTSVGLELFYTPAFQLTWNNQDGGPEEWRPFIDFCDQTIEMFNDICSKNEDEWSVYPPPSE